MIENFRIDEEADSFTIIDVTPESLNQAARKLQLAKEKALPGEQILLRIGERTMFRYNPEVSAAVYSKRTSKRPDEAQPLPTTETIAEAVRQDEARQQAH